MKIIRVLVCVIAIFIGDFYLGNTANAFFDNWKTEDKLLYGAWGIAHGIDLLQTREIFDNPNFYELNPVFRSVDKDWSTAIMLLEYPLVYWMVDEFPKIRTFGLGILTGVSVGLIIHNNNIGVRIGARW